MNIYAFIPLIAAIAYIPLFLILVNNRPWKKQHWLFAVYLIAAMLWSLSSSILRSDFLAQDKLVIFRVSICSFMWMTVQFYYFVRFYLYRNEGFETYVGYTLLAFLIAGAALGYVPQGFAVEATKISPDFGWWLMLILIPPIFLILSLILLLLRRLKISTDPAECNRIFYFFVGVGIVAVFVVVGLATPLGDYFPVAHVGHLFNAVVLTYATVRHRLLDMRVVIRRGIVYVFMACIFLMVYALWLSLLHLVLHVNYSFASILAVGVLTAVSAAAFWAQMRVYIYRKVDQIFYGKGYGYRQDLVDFLQRKAPTVSNLEEFGRELVVPITKAVDCLQAYLLFPEVGTKDFVIQIAQPENTAGSSPKIKHNSPILEWLTRENRYLNLENLEILPEFRGMWGEEKDWIEAMDIELLFPLVSRSKLTAVLALSKKKSGKYSLDDVNLIETVATQVATSLEKEYLQEELKKREQELALINRLASVISSSLNIRDVYGAFITELKQVVDVNWATIALIDGDDIRFEVLSTEVGSTWQAGEKIPLKGTGTEWVATHKKALVEPDLTKNARFKTGEDHLRWGIRSIIYLPLMVKNEVIGSLIIASRRPNAYIPSQVRLLERLASQIAVAVDNSRLYSKAEQRARVDELTGLFNRRHFDESVKLEIDRHARYRSMLSLILLDLDFFKAYNDTQGHTAGDRILELIGRSVAGALRNTDLAFRYGGDEFAIILPQSTTNDAFIVAERVRGRIAAEMTKRDIKVSASLGLASWPSDGVTSDELVNAADRALYYAKETGGNRTCVVSKMLPSLTEAALSDKTTTEKEVLSIIHTLAATIEARDPYTYGHSRKVSSYAVSLAEAIGLPSEKVAIVSTAALLHDIGKIGVPDDVLFKVDKLEPEAWELIRAHPKLSTTIVGHVVSLVSCLPAILHHHERWDGNGYPAGLKGDEIPVEARVLAIADAFDAMTSSRPYRNKLSYKKVLQELKRCSGTQFDPKMVDAFLPIALSAAPEESSVA